MIKQIQIDNFQSHKDTHFAFDPGVNVIVGTSDSGKSAVIRALKWLIRNKAPANFRSGWGGDTQIVLLSDNIITRIITRTKTNKDNEYSLDDAIYKSFNKDVPEEIAQALNFSDINTQFQMDPSFLLSESAGEVARTLNRIVNLDAIDISLANIEKTKRKIKTDISYAKDNLESYELSMTEFTELDEMEKDIKQIEEAIENRDALSNYRIELVSKLQGYKSICNELKDHIDYEPALKLIEELEKLSREKEKLTVEIREAEELIENTEACNDLMHTTIYRLDKLECEYKKLMPEICPLCEQEIK